VSTFARFRRQTAPGWLAAALAGCLGWLAACDHTSTIAVTLVSAPDSALLDDVVRARLTLTQPPAVVEAERDASGAIVLALDVPAERVRGDIVFEGFGEDGALIAYGRSGPLPITGVTIDIALYAAAPLSLAETPLPLGTPRADMGIAVLSYGALLAGGRAEDGAASAAVEIYSVYQHAFQEMNDLPAARIAPAVTAGARDEVYLFGGLDDDGAPSDAFYRFDTGTTPGGAGYALTTEGAGLSRAGAAMVALGQERFAVTGMPPVRIEGLPSRASAWDDAPALAGTATSAVIDGAVYTLFAGAGNGESGAILLVADRFTELDPPEGADNPLLRTGHATALLPDGSMLVLGGALETAAGTVLPASAARLQPDSGRWEVTELLATPRTHAAAAATGEYLVVAGGVDGNGALAGDAEVFDAASLGLVATLPLIVPRSHAAAVPLPNGQVLIVGGVDAAGAPVATAELFTPAP
jgi:hypothetical protein